MSLRSKVGQVLRKAAQLLSPIAGIFASGYAAAGWTTLFETRTGGWQQDIKIDRDSVARNWAVFSCVSLIAGDIAKMAARVMEYDAAQKIWLPTQLSRQVLQKPNHFQTRVDFLRCWVYSLLLNGNTYVLKQRDSRGFITALYILDPQRVTPLIAPDGQVYYQLGDDWLSQLNESSMVAPATEIIHDRLYTPWHPLIGVSPLTSCGLAAMASQSMMKGSAKFFENMSRPSGILTAPGTISDATAARLKEEFQKNYSKGNLGQVAVLGDNLKYEAMSVNAVDAQLLEQLKFSSEVVCATYHVPPYKLGMGQMPTVSNTGTLNQQYYDQALQPICESIEVLLTEGLELTLDGAFSGYEVKLDTDVLMRMDPAARFEAHNKAVQGGWLAPNEARRDEDLPPVAGGETPYLQQQNYSLAALAKRDALPNPFANATPPAPKPPDPPPDALAARELVYLIAHRLRAAL